MRLVPPQDQNYLVFDDTAGCDQNTLGVRMSRLTNSVKQESKDVGNSGELRSSGKLLLTKYSVLSKDATINSDS